MTEDCHSDKMPNVVRKDSLSDSATNLGTEAVQPLPRQPDEDIDLHIPDEQLSTESDAAAENRQTIGISPRDNCDTYAIAYICLDHITYETTTVATIVASNSSHNDDLNLAGCGASENDSDTSIFIQNDSTAHTETRDPNPMYTQSSKDPPPNDVTPNPMYTESAMNPNDATTYNPMYTESTMNPSSNEDNPNPMYTQSTMNPSSNEVNPNQMYLQTTTELNVSPGLASKSSNSDDNPCSQSSAETRQQGDEVTFIPANSDGNQRLQPYAVTKLQGGDEESVVETANIGNNPRLRPYAVKCLKPLKKSVVESASCDVARPYAVRYQKETVESANNDSDPYIQPYAVRYDEPAIQATDRVPAASDGINNDVVTNPLSNDGNPPGLVSDERQHVPNVLHPNPINAPNAQHPSACENHLQWNATVATVFTSGPTGYYSSVPTPPAVSNSSQLKESYSRLTTTVASTLTAIPTRCIPPAVSSSSQLKENHDKLETITGVPFHGMAVSADNEIFGADMYMRRVQVFSITGTLLRRFSTVVPGTGGDRMKPYTVAMDVEPDYLWVAGMIEWTITHWSVNVVQYHKTGRPLKTFGFRRKIDYFASADIAMDVRNKNVILADGDKILMFQRNGSLVRSFRVDGPTNNPTCSVASDCEGNVMLLDRRGRIKVYNHFGDKILDFGSNVGTCLVTQGISVDPLGRILVVSNRNNRVDMFTNRGEFDRTVMNTEKNPRYIAVGPAGQLVVSNTMELIVTIFPRHMLFP
uniref:SMP-30/Gluconolactonase/LRE-like region domain-containing protein n=1 Tax=Branchiostoma floridae TaxID=7739 RepID=C3Z035_BRAFL|eukprot:XP_002598082.1 hypothetical protein BRAFLDRAFT_85701 [Branchiostoma floridae]